MKNKYNRPENSFDTPLRVVSDDAGYIVYNNSNEIVCQDAYYVDAKRMARMPELYDALTFVVHDKCSNCGFAVATAPVDFCKDCKYKTFTELLKKVRDGE